MENINKVTEAAINAEIEAAQVEVESEKTALAATIKAAEEMIKAAKQKVKDAEKGLIDINAKQVLFNYPFKVVNENQRSRQLLEEQDGVLYLTTQESRISGCSCCSIFWQRRLGQVLAELRACLALRGCTKLVIRVEKGEDEESGKQWQILNLDELKPVMKTREVVKRDRYGNETKVVETYEEEPEWSIYSDVFPRTFPHIPGLVEWEFYTPDPAPSP